MENEKYGIELELITNKFKEKMQDVKSSFKSLGNQDVDLSKSVKINSLTSKIKIAEREVAMLRSQLKDLEHQRGVLLPWQVDSGKGAQLNAEIDKTIISLDKAKQKTQEFKDQLELLTTTAPKVAEVGQGTTIASSGIDKLITKVKRFGLSLLSIRSIYALVSRASSAYLAQDTQLSERLQRIWVGLGAILAPIIEFIATVLEKALGFINVFVKALTGVDLLARASAKSINKTTGAVKALNKALSTFDELQNLDTDANGGGIGGGLNNLLNFDDFGDSDGLWNKFRKWLLGSDETDIGGILKDNLEIIKQHIKNVGAAFEPLVNWLKINVWNPMKKNFEETMKAFAPLLEPVKKAFDYTVNGYIKPLWKSFEEYLRPNVIDPIIEDFQPVGKEIHNALVPYANMIIDMINATFGVFGVNLKHWEYETEKTSKNNEKNITASMKKTQNSSDAMKGAVIGNLDKIQTKVGNVNSKPLEIKTNTSKIKTLSEKIGGVFSKLKELVGRTWNINTRIQTSGGSSLNNWLQPLRNALSQIGIHLPMLATGTNYVPEDQLAMIHKGEAVVPKKFNSKEYFGGTSDETNAKLDEVIQAINNIEINPYTTIRDVGKASLNYINNKSRQLGESVVM